MTPQWDVLGSKWRMRSETSSPPVRTEKPGLSGMSFDLETRTLGQWDVRSPHPGAAVDAHYYASKALQYFKEVHGRNGLDGNGGGLLVIVHDPEADSKGANAHYAHSGIFFDADELHVGDGDGGELMAYSAGFDILSHELTHGVTNRTSGLVYERESGALNEAFSDVMAASAENWLPETRNPLNNVLIGERLSKSGKGLRRMDDPSADARPERDHYREREPCPKGEKPASSNDHCSVHRNSGIANRAFTLMTLGGTHKSSKATVARGIGWEAARTLWFHSFTRLTPQATFFQAASVQMAQAAVQGLDVLSAVACAWFAVGVVDTTDMRLRNIACGAAPDRSRGPSSCDGVANGYVCNSSAPYSAMICRNGNFSGAVLCSDLGQRCKPRSTADYSAALNPDNSLICE